MPPETQSVLVMRYEELVSDDSILKDDIRRSIDHGSNDPEASELFNEILDSAMKANLLVRVAGGSEFTPITRDSSGIGVGNYNGRMVLYIEKSLKPLIDRLKKNENIKNVSESFKVENVPVFQSIERERGLNAGEYVAIDEELYFAFYNDRCVVVTESVDETKHILNHLGSDAAELPAKWAKAAAGLDIESPILILRQYDPKNELDYFSPVNRKNPEWKKSDTQGFGIILKSVKSLTFRMNCESREPQRAAAFFASDFFSQEIYAWNSRFRETGFEADISVIDEKRSKAHPLLTIYVLFGPNIFI